MLTRDELNALRVWITLPLPAEPDEPDTVDGKRRIWVTQREAVWGMRIMWHEDVSRLLAHIDALTAELATLRSGGRG